MRPPYRMRHAAVCLIGIVMIYGWFWLIGADRVYAATGAISGTVTNAEGNPLANVGVQLYLDPSGSGLWMPAGIYGVSDQTGQYTLADVDANTYRLSFNDGGWPLVYASEYYNNQLRLEKAQNVTVTADETVTVDAQLANVSRIEGTITDTDGTPIDGIQVSLWLHNSTNPTEWSSALRHTTTDGNGAYAFEGVDIGNYQLGFTDLRSPHTYSTEYYQNALLSQATTIAVTNQETFVINAELAKTGTVTGKVIDQDGNSLPGITASIGNDIESDGWSSSPYFRAGVTDATGVYTLTGVDVGPNRLCFSDYTYHYADECYNDGPPDLQRATDITVTAGTTLTANAQLALRGGISGAVTDASGQPLPAHQVYLYSDPHDDGNWVSGGNWAYTNATGVYSFTGLNPDVYHVSFKDPGQVNAPEFYNDALTIEDATDIVVRPGEITPHINAQLEPFSHITGTVTDNQGQPLENIFVSVYRIAPDPDSVPFLLPTYGTYTNQDGTYNLTGIPGQYFVGFADTYHNALHSEYYDDAGYLMTATPITVGRVMTVTNINAQLLPFEAVNYPPFATSDTADVLKGGTTRNIPLPINDAESAPLTTTLLTSPTQGTVTLAANSLFTYTHNGGESTQDFFTYRAFDGIHYSTPATVTMIIKPVSSIEFTKTVWIAGLPTPCGITNTLRVPVSTTVAYCYTVHNSSSVTFTQHTLADDDLGVILTEQDYTLPPGTTHHVIVIATIAVTTTNVATWTAATSRFTPVEPITATATATVTRSTPTDDQDQDSIPDVIERAGDLDRDNLPNFLDPDADGDTILDQVEVGSNPLMPQDSNNDGIPDYLDPFVPFAKHFYLPLLAR